uniref:Cytochrome c oxidase assembly factor 3 mitochondrial coiled-coil domain-containing protein n=4 Tax=Paniceae TaxID=147428 RepID=K3ZAG6_SETIT
MLPRGTPPCYARILLCVRARLPANPHACAMIRAPQIGGSSIANLQTLLDNGGGGGGGRLGRSCSRSSAAATRRVDPVVAVGSGGIRMAGFRSLAPKTRNLVVAGGLSAFVLGVYYYTMRAVGGTDELQVAIDKFEEMKKKDAGNSSNAGS